MFAHLLRFLSFYLLLLLWTTVATAQTPMVGISDDVSAQAIELPDPLTPETVRGMVSKLSDEQVRSLLLERLDAVARQRAAENSTIEVGVGELFQTWVGFIGTSVYTAIVRVPRIWDGFKTSTSNLYDKHEAGGIFKIILIMIGAVVAGLIAENFVNRLISSKRDNIQQIDDSLFSGS